MRIRDLRSDVFRQRRPRLNPQFRTFLSLAVLVAFPLAASHSQTSVTSYGNTIHDYSNLPHPGPLANPKPDANQLMEYEMQRMNAQKRIEKLNTLRQKEMTEDTNRLLALAREVHKKTAADPNSISAIQLQEIDAIEKLARSVREKMEFTVSQ